MAKGILVIGTDTDVGKTFVTAGLTYILRQNGYNACPFKPVQSGCATLPDGRETTDVDFTAAMAGFSPAESSRFAVYTLRAAVSPHLAARLENRVIQPAEILNRYGELAGRYDYIVAEACGGLVVPLNNHRYFVYDLARELNLACLLVARTKIGTINHTVLTVEFARRLGIEMRGIVYNGFTGQEYENDNIKNIEEITGLATLAVLPSVPADEDFMAAARRVYEKELILPRVWQLWN